MRDEMFPNWAGMGVGELPGVGVGVAVGGGVGVDELPGVGVGVAVGAGVGVAEAPGVGLGVPVGAGVGVGVAPPAGVRVTIAVAGVPREPFSGLLRLTLNVLLVMAAGLFKSAIVIVFVAVSASAQERVPLAGE
jgi:hypothetical protein